MQQFTETGYMDEETLIRFHSFCKDVQGDILPTPCWIWQGCKTWNGYPKFRCKVAGAKGTSKAQRAHRVAYLHYVGKIKRGMHLHHMCENEACANPFHTMQATPAQNNAYRNEALKRDMQNRSMSIPVYVVQVARPCYTK